MMNEDTNPPQPTIDPDNPPLTGKEKFVPAGPHIKAKIAAHKAKHAARQQAQARKPDAVE